MTNSNFEHHWPLLPVGEWRFDLIVTKNINGSDELIVSGSLYYELKPTGAKEF